jgi:hypothetical protein
MTREEIILKSIREYHQVRGKQPVLCSAVAWVNGELRQHKISPLTDDEVRRLSVPVGDSRNLSKQPADRASVIAASRRGYGQLLANGQAAICSLRAWIDGDLRSSGLALLSNSEAISLEIPRPPAA